jgi:hypothetical protein
MEFTYESALEWFKAYYEDVDRSQENLQTVPNLGKYFTADLEFIMYTAPLWSSTTGRSRDMLLMSFVHPGLHETLIPQYYIVDVKQMIVAVQFEIRFSDKPSGQTWPPIQASAHYHLVLDEKKELRIRKIHYWTGPIPRDIGELWADRRNEALTAHGMSFIKGKA